MGALPSFLAGPGGSAIVRGSGTSLWGPPEAGGLWVNLSLPSHGFCVWILLVKPKGWVYPPSSPLLPRLNFPEVLFLEDLWLTGRCWCGNTIRILYCLPSKKQKQKTTVSAQKPINHEGCQVQQSGLEVKVTSICSPALPHTHG